MRKIKMKKNSSSNDISFFFFPCILTLTPTGTGTLNLQNAGELDEEGYQQKKRRTWFSKTKSQGDARANG
jgi:hypothetical protein